MSDESTPQPEQAGGDQTNPGDSCSASSRSADPTAIRSVAVTVDDVVAALEATLGANRSVVLRITPPFSGRMRARLHVGDEQPYEGIEPIHLDPTALVERVPSYPTADETATQLSAAEPNSKRHRETHTERLVEWRETVRSRIVDEVTVQTANGSTTVGVVPLGTQSAGDDRTP